MKCFVITIISLDIHLVAYYYIIDFMHGFVSQVYNFFKLGVDGGCITHELIPHITGFYIMYCKC